MSFHYRVARSSPYTLTHIVTIPIAWRRIPKLLHTISTQEFNVAQAQILTNQITLHLQEYNMIISGSKQSRLLTDLRDALMAPADILSETSIHIPSPCKFSLYNVPSFPYSTMEIECPDRAGLLQDLLSFLGTMPYELHSAFSSANHDKDAHHTFHYTFHMQMNNTPLSPQDMDYMQNVFAYHTKCSTLQMPLL